MILRALKTFTICFLICFSSHTKANEAQFVKLDSGIDIQDVTSKISISWQEPHESLSEQFVFVEYTDKDLNAKYSNQALWMRLGIENTKSNKVHKILYFTTYLVGELALFELGKGPMQVNGSSIPFYERSYLSRFAAFEIDLAPREKKQFYIRRLSHQSLSTRIHISEESSFLNIESDLKATLYFYAGGIFCLIFFNLLVGLYTGDRDFLYYSFFAGTLALAILNLNGVLDSFAFRNYHTTFTKYLMSFTGTAIIASLVFVYHFLKLDIHLPKIKRLFVAIGSVGFFLVCYSIFFQGEYYWSKVGFVTDITILISLVSLISTGVYLARRGLKIANFFLLSWAFLFLGAAAYFGVLYGILPSTPLFYHGILYGNLTEMLVISLGLAYKLNVLDFEKRQALKDAAEKEHYHRLVKVLSHDVSNASFIFSMYFMRLKKRISDPQGEVVIQKIEATLKKMDQILASVKNEQAFKSFQNSIQLVKTNLTEVVIEVLHFYEDRFETKDLKVDLDMPPEVFVMADRSALGNQVISNIVSNAIKFSKTNGLISIKLSEANGDYKLSIEDQGIGIPKDQIHKIFFSNNGVSTSGTSFEKGSGLGTSLIREYMKLFCGDLEVESQTAEGIVSSGDFLTGTNVTLVFPKAK